MYRSMSGTRYSSGSEPQDCQNTATLLGTLGRVGRAGRLVRQTLHLTDADPSSIARPPAFFSTIAPNRIDHNRLSNRKEPRPETFGISHLLNFPKRDQKRLLRKIFRPVNIPAFHIQMRKYQPAGATHQLLEGQSVSALTPHNQRLIRFAQTHLLIKS